MSVLYIGGTGQISLPCVYESIAQGHNVTVFNRGKAEEDLPEGVEVIIGDMKDPESYRQLAERHFDIVCQFMVFTPDQMQQDLEVFSGRTEQYVFISSASVYEKPPRHYVITEETPAINPYWPYSQAKIECEAMLRGQSALPFTIVRPSHTVRNGLPSMLNDGDSAGLRMLAGKPVVVAGDGTTPWTLTRSADFATPFVKLLGNERARGEIFHITSDYAYTWNDIYKTIGAGLGVEPQIVHVPTDTLVRYNPDWAGPLLGDKTWTALFDNSKVKRIAGEFSCASALDEVLAEPIAHLKKRIANGNPRKGNFDELMDRVAANQAALGQ